MRKTAIVLFVSLVLLSTAAMAGDEVAPAGRVELFGAKADVPRLISYQGTLTDPAGVALDTTVSMTFSIYTDSTGGSMVWSEWQLAVAVGSGIFNVLLGRVNTIADTVFSDPARWLGIQVGGDAELEPRQRIAAVGYAFRAAEADTAEYARGAPAAGIDSVMYADSSGYAPMPDSVVHAVYADTADHAVSAETDGDWTVSGSDMYSAVSGNVGIGKASPAAKLDVKGAVNTDSLYQIAGNTILSTDTTGCILIGFGSGASGLGYASTFVGDSVAINDNGYDNTYIGWKAGYASASCWRNTFVGCAAGSSNTDGDQNTFIGDRAGNANITGYFNTFVGQRAGYSNTDGSANSFYGHLAGTGNTSGHSNTFMGGSAGKYNTVGYHNTFLGLNAGFLNDSGEYNTVLGTHAGYANAAGDSNVFIGSHAGYYENGSNKLYIANDRDTSSVLIYGDFSSGELGLGTLDPAEKLDVAGTVRMTGFKMPNGASNGYVLTSDGSGAGTWQSVSADGDWTVSGSDIYSAVSGNVGIGTSSPGQKLHILGANPRILLEASSASPEIDFMSTGDPASEVWAIYKHVGTDDLHFYQVGEKLTIKNGTGDVGIGKTSPSAKLDVAGMVSTDSAYQIGGETVLSVEGLASVFVGVGAGKNDSGGDNTFIGAHAGSTNTDGDNNTFLGAEAGRDNTTGGDNTFIGNVAGLSNTEGGNNTFLGYGAGRFNTTGTYNTFLGKTAGHSNTTGEDNIFIGVETGHYHTEGNDNTFVGVQAGFNNDTGAGNVFLGHGAGYSETGSEKLYIANAIDTASVLIYGEFDNGKVGLGTLTPAERLHVAGDVKVDSTLQTVGFKMPTGASSGHVLTSDGSGAGTWQAATGGADGDWTIAGSNMYSAVSGNVGIGTSTPDMKLTLEGPTDAMALAKINQVGGRQYAGLRVDRNDTETWFIGMGNTNDRLVFRRSASSDEMVIDTTGNVGIGTSAPEAHLHVDASQQHAGLFENDFTGGIVEPDVIYADYTGTGNYDATAVYGVAAPADFYGWGGNFLGGYTGVKGKVSPSGAQSYFGVYGTVSGGSGYNYGVYGNAYGSGTNYGIYGTASGSGTNYAGYFDGLLHATTATASVKAFKIDHPLDPENKYLYHSSVESPDMKNVYDGVVILDSDGQAVVSLPDYFQALNRDFRYQLTAIGAPGPNLYIAEKISGNRFQIAGGQPGMEVSWMVTGIRHDPVAEAGRIDAEKIKPSQERGKYLNPEAYGQPESMGVGYVDREKMRSVER